MRTRQLLLFFLLWPFIQAYAQPTAERLAYLKANAIVVRDVEPTNEDYTDLAPLRQKTCCSVLSTS